MQVGRKGRTNSVVVEKKGRLSEMGNSKNDCLNYSQIARPCCSVNKQKRCNSVKQSVKKISQQPLLQTSKATSGKKKMVRPPLARITDIESPMLKNYAEQGPHFMTVAELQSAQRDEPSKQKKMPKYQQSDDRDPQNKLQDSPVKNYKQSSVLQCMTNKSDNDLNQYLSNRPSIPMPQDLQKKLDATIGKLRSKQQTISVLNKTIQTKLIEIDSDINKNPNCTNRLQVYEIEMNFYIDKINELQRQLYQKNKMMKVLAGRDMEYGTVVKNSRKLVMENGRLREEKELILRENQVLKNIIGKKCQSQIQRRVCRNSNQIALMGPQNCSFSVKKKENETIEHNPYNSHKLDNSHLQANNCARNYF